MLLGLVITLVLSFDGHRAIQEFSSLLLCLVPSNNAIVSATKLPKGTMSLSVRLYRSKQQCHCLLYKITPLM